MEVVLKDAPRVFFWKWFRVLGKCRFKKERGRGLLLGVNKAETISNANKLDVHESEIVSHRGSRESSSVGDHRTQTRTKTSHSVVDIF